jgi:hypothetical protein
VPLPQHSTTIFPALRSATEVTEPLVSADIRRSNSSAQPSAKVLFVPKCIAVADCVLAEACQRRKEEKERQKLEQKSHKERHREMMCKRKRGKLKKTKR